MRFVDNTVMKVIITDIHTRKAFDIVNILKRHGYKLELVSGKSFLHRLFLSMVYLKRVKKSCEKDGIVLPTEDTTLEKIITEKYIFKVPSKESFKIVLDKERFSIFCEENNFLVPKRFTVKELESYDFKKPLILKPKTGSGSSGIKFIDTKEELNTVSVDFNDYIIQERLENPKNVEGAFFLFDKGEVVSFYSHKRIKTYPKRGGVTIYSVSTNNTVLKETGAKLLRKLDWSGFAMIEFLYDEKSQKYYIIELNPRVWGSIMLSEFCGTNMLSNYIKLCQNKSVVKTTPKEGKSIRWLIPWDVGYLIKNFYKLDRENCCYINFSYASMYSSSLFLLYNIFNPSVLRKLFKKLLS